MELFAQISFCAFIFMTYSVNKVHSDYLVATKNGIVNGTQEKTVHTSKIYYAFRGIPFAKPPVEGLRFEPPQPIDNWDNILDATQEKDECLQLTSTTVKTSKIVGNEDCLYLSVHTPVHIPHNCSTSTPKAVMVWIYGGGFFEGDTTDEVYGPDYLVNEDIILVKLAYRLNLFGFLSTGDLNYPGNMGLKDLIMGLKWVKENIKAFGGDPERITIFGESAGGALVSYLTQSPLTAGLYNRAIMQSGVSLCIWALSRNARKVVTTTGELLGLNTTNLPDLVTELKTIEYRKLHSASMLAANRIHGAYPINGLSNAPVIEPEHPGAVVTKKTIDILESGEFNLTPLMIGFNSMEGVDFQPVIDIVRLYLLRINLDSSGLTPVDLNINKETIKESVGKLIKDYYFAGANGTFTDRQCLRYIGDHYFVRDVIQTVSLLLKHTKVFFYRFSHLGELGNPLRSYDYGTGHAEDLNYLFYRITTPPILDESDTLVRDRMVKLWTNFAKYGNPTPKKDDLLQQITWPESTNNLDYLDINRNLGLGAHPHQEDYNFWMDIYSNYGRI